MSRKIFNVPMLWLRMNQVLLIDWDSCIVTDAFGIDGVDFGCGQCQWIVDVINALQNFRCADAPARLLMSLILNDTNDCADA